MFVRKAMLVVLAMLTGGLCLLWLISQWRVIGIGYRQFDNHRFVSISSVRHQIHFMFYRVWLPQPWLTSVDMEWFIWRHRLDPAVAVGHNFVWIFDKYPDPSGNGRNIWLISIGIPYWAMMLPLGLATALITRSSIREYVAHRRQQRGACLACGYDLRAHHPGQKCPECGTVVPAGSGAAAGKAGAG